jgi:nicotinate-nucleotide adenylyltransferase
MNDGGPIGLLGGSFDPVHAGHVQLAQSAAAELGLASLRFLPAARPWQKGALTAGTDRLQMLELALQGRAHWSIDPREFARPGPSYTIDTLRALREELGPRQPLVWLLGFDQLRGLPSWHRWEELIGFAHLAYAQRAGAQAPLDAAMRRYVDEHRGSVAQLRTQAAGTIVEFAMPPVDCSATTLRRWLAEGKDSAAAAFLAPAVLDFIHRRHLYVQAHGQ